MKHFGDITKIHGWDVPIVDCVIGGSPCQDLSTAGKRKGLAGERSGLFMEQIRIIKEMREHDRTTNKHRGMDVRCRWMVWENVQGAFSSNGGDDFRAVLEETARISEEGVSIPRLKEGEKWAHSGVLFGDQWSIAWRLHDSQYHGVPQRRKRIALLADFNGHAAPDLLFECFREASTDGSYEVIRNLGALTSSTVQTLSESMSGDSQSFSKEGQGTSEDSKGGTRTTGNGTVKSIAFEPGAASRLGGHVFEEFSGTLRADAGDNRPAVLCLNDQGGEIMDVSEDKSGTLRSEAHGHAPIVYGLSSYDSNSMKSSNPHSGIYEADTARTLDLNGGNPGCNQGGMAVVQGADVYNGTMTGDIAAPVTTGCGCDDASGPKVVCLEGNGSRPSHKGDGYAETEISYTLNATEKHAVAYRKTSHPKTKFDGQGWEEAKTADTLNTTDNGEARTPTLVLEKQAVSDGLAVESHAQDARYKVGDINQPLSANMEHDPSNGGLVYVVENHPNDSRVKIREDNVFQTLSSRMGTGGGNVPMVLEDLHEEEDQIVQKSWDGGDIASTLTANNADGSQRMPDKNNFNAVISFTTEMTPKVDEKGVAFSLRNRDNKDPQSVAYVPQESTTTAIVRRLTPGECTRLQGFPDNWLEIGEWVDSTGKKHKDADSPKYRALGNSIALPFWATLMKRISAEYSTPPTMASLFDGIGGFPLCWENANGKGTAVWASEIEEFPIAVTKYHFPEEEGE